MDHIVSEDVKRQRLRDFNRKAKMLLNANDREFLYTTLKRYQKEKKLSRLLQCLRTILDTPTKLDLLKDIRAFIPPNQITEYDVEVPYHNMARPVRASQSLSNLTSARLYTHAPTVAPALYAEAPVVFQHQAYVHEAPAELLDPASKFNGIQAENQYNSHQLQSQRGGYAYGSSLSLPRTRAGGTMAPLSVMTTRPASAHTTPQRLRRRYASAHDILVCSVHVEYGEELGLSIRGGKEHGLGIFITEIQPGSPAERSRLEVGDQVMEVNSVQFASIASSSAVTVLTGSEYLKVKVKRVGLIPAHKASKEKIAWFNVEERRLVYTDPFTSRGDKLVLPGTLGLQADERKINLSRSANYLEEKAHLGFNVRGGAEYDLPLFVSKVDPGGLAQRNGLKAGDQLLRVNGSDVTHVTHEQCVRLIKSSRTPVLTVKDVGMYPAHKDIYTEYKWVNVHSGEITKSKSYRKHALGDNATLESIPVLPGDEQAPYRQHFVESRLDDTLFSHHGDAERDDLDDVMTHMFEPSKPKHFTSRMRAARFVTNLHSGATLELNTPVPKSAAAPGRGDGALVKNKFRSEQILATDNHNSRPCYVYSKKDHYFYSQGEDNHKSAMECAMDFTSLQDIHAASMVTHLNTKYDVTNTDGEDELDMSGSKRHSRWSRRRSVDDSSLGDSTRRNSSSKRDKSAPPRSNLAVRALESEARQQHPELARQHSQDLQRKKGDSDNTSESGSKSRLKAFKERFFSSKSKHGSGKKRGKLRKSLVEIDFKHDHNSAMDTRQVELEAAHLLSEDEVQALRRHLQAYESRAVLSGLLAPLFAILDTQEKLQLCTHIRPLLLTMDRAAFDVAVDQHQRQLQGEASAKTVEQVSPNQVRTRRASMESTHSTTSVSSYRRKKRQAPLPPSKQNGPVTIYGNKHSTAINGSDSVTTAASTPTNENSSKSPEKYSTTIDLGSVTATHTVRKTNGEEKETKTRQKPENTQRSHSQVSRASRHGSLKSEFKHPISTSTLSKNIVVIEINDNDENNEIRYKSQPKSKPPLHASTHSSRENQIQDSTNLNEQFIDKSRSPLHTWNQNTTAVEEHSTFKSYKRQTTESGVRRKASIEASMLDAQQRTESYAANLMVVVDPNIDDDNVSITPGSSLHSPTQSTEHFHMQEFVTSSSSRNDTATQSNSETYVHETRKQRVIKHETVHGNALHDFSIVPTHFSLHDEHKPIAVEFPNQYFEEDSPSSFTSNQRGSVSESKMDTQTKQQQAEVDNIDDLSAALLQPAGGQGQVRSSESTYQVGSSESTGKGQVRSSESSGEVLRKKSSGSFKAPMPLLNSTMDYLDSPKDTRRQQIVKNQYEQDKVDTGTVKSESSDVIMILGDGVSTSSKHTVPDPPPLPPLPVDIPLSRDLAAHVDSSKPTPLAKIITYSMVVNGKQNLKPVNKDNKPFFNSVESVTAGIASTEKKSTPKDQEKIVNHQEAKSNTQLEESQSLKPVTNGNFLEQASKTLERYKKTHTPQASRNASPAHNDDVTQNIHEVSISDVKKRADDTVSLAESTMTCASLFRADPELPVHDYVESSSVFPVYETVRDAQMNNSFGGNFKMPPLKKREAILVQSESVTEATSALDFLDTMETESQWDSSVIATHGEVSGVYTPRSEDSATETVATINTTHDSTSTIQKRPPPQFFAPPPPSEPPPSDDEERSLADTCSCSDFSSAPSHNTSLVNGEAEITSNPLRTSSSKDLMMSSKEADALFGFLDDTKNRNNDTNDSAYNTGETIDGMENDRRNGDKISTTEDKPKSWLFRKSQIRPPTPRAPHCDDITGFFTSPEDDEINMALLSDKRLIYLDKTFKTLGLSISGGTDSKSQPEIRVKAVFPGGAVQAEGSLKPGIQILSLDGTSLIDVTHMRAVVTIKRSFDNKANSRMAVEIKP